MSIEKVVLVGASGSVGTPILEALRKSFSVTVLTRKSSSSKFPPDVRVVSVSDDYPLAELAEALKGQDAVVSTIATLSTAAQHNLVDAALQAGVKRFIPAEFGGNTLDPETERLLPSIFGSKRDLRRYLESKESEGLTWTAIAVGIIFDWAFQKTQGTFLHLDLEKRTALVQDDGEHQFSMSNLDQIALAVVRVLQRPEETKNKFLFIQSFLVTQNQLVFGLEKELGGKKFEVTKVSNKDFLAENSARARAQPHDLLSACNVIYAWILSHGDNTRQPTFANGILGLPEEDFESSLKDALVHVKY